MNRENRGVWRRCLRMLLLLLWLSGCGGQLASHPAVFYGLVNKSVTLRSAWKEGSTKPNIIEWTKEETLTVIEREHNDISVFKNHFNGRVQLENGIHLQIDNLKMKDAGIYSLKFKDIGEPPQKFNLSVIEPVSSVNISTVCPDVQTCGDNCSITLSCSALHGFPVNYSWTVSRNQGLQSETRILMVSLLPDNSKFNFTCTAKNVFTNATSTVVPWNECYLKAREMSKGSSLRTFGGSVILIVALNFWMFYCCC